MAKKSVGKTMPPGISTSTPDVKSTNDLIKEVEEIDGKKSLVETIAEKENNNIDDTPTNDGGNTDNNKDGASDDNNTGGTDNTNGGGKSDKKDDKYVSNAKMSPAFAKKLAKKEKVEKKKTMIYLDEYVMNQFKTLSKQSGYSVTKLLETACLDYIKGQEVDEYLVAEYDETNLRKGQRPNQNKK